MKSRLFALACASLMAPSDDGSGGSGGAPSVASSSTAPSATVAGTAPAPAVVPPVEIRNSLWVTDPNGRVGQVAEINSQIASVKLDNCDGFSTYPVEHLKVARAVELPPHVQFTAEQLAEYGYK